MINWRVFYIDETGQEIMFLVQAVDFEHAESSAKVRLQTIHTLVGIIRMDIHSHGKVGK